MNTFSAQRWFCFVSAWCMWWGLCQAGRRFDVILALLAASHTSLHPPGLMLVCLFVSLCMCTWVCVHELLSPSARISCLFSPSPSAFHSLCLPLHAYLSSTATHRKWNLSKKRHPGRLPSKSTRGQSALVWHNRKTSFALLWCSQFKLGKECCERGTSLRREGGKDGRREGRRMREKERDQVKRTKWKSARETNLCVCEYVWICVYMGGTNLREEMGALRVLSTPFSSSHSWEIWSTELGGTNTQTQIKLLSWEQVFLPRHQSAVFCQPLLKLRLKALLCKRGLLSNTEKNSFHGEKRETNETHLLISILVFH